MAISFNQIPSDIRVPFLYAEVDSSGAMPGAGTLRYKALLIGQMLAAGTAEAGELVRVTSAGQARALAGEGSMLALMAEAWFAANEGTEVWLLPLGDDGSATQSAWTLTVTATDAKAGTISLYIGGRRVRVGVDADDAQNAIATAIKDAIDGDGRLPVTAAVTDNVVTVTARNAGLAAGQIPIVLNYFDDEELPEGVGVEVAQTVTGATNPDLEEGLDAIGDEWFQIWVQPYTDTANLTATDAELEERFGPLAQKDGLAISAATGTQGQLATLGQGPNSKHISIVPATGSPHAPYSWAAAVAGIVAIHGQIDPARPFQTLQVPHVLPPRRDDRFDWAERNQLLHDGISTILVDDGGRVRLERMITTYRKDAFGGDDIAYLDVNTRLTLMYLRWDWRTYWLQKYPRHKLANDGAQFAPGQAVVTPAVGRSEAVARYQLWEELGLVEGLEGFKAGLIVERNAGDPNRLDFLLRPNLMNQMRVAGVQLAFLLFDPSA